MYYARDQPERKRRGEAKGGARAMTASALIFRARTQTGKSGEYAGAVNAEKDKRSTVTTLVYSRIHDKHLLRSYIFVYIERVTHIHLFNEKTCSSRRIEIAHRSHVVSKIRSTIGTRHEIFR